MMDFSAFPTLNNSGPPPMGYLSLPQPPAPTGNPLIAGVKAGAGQAVADIASTLGAGAQVLGMPGTANYLNTHAGYVAANSAAANRPDLDAQSWFGHGIGGFLNKGVYETAKTLPVLAGAIGATALMPEVAVPEGVAALGAAVPRVLGGAGAALGTAGAEDLATGAGLARNIAAAGAVMYPGAVAGQYTQAEKAPGGATTMDAAKSLLFGAPLAAIQGVVPGGEAGLLTRGSEGTILKRVAGAGIANAAAGAVSGGINTAADLAYRPDISAVDKAKAIVSATVQSGALGGVIGGMFGALGGSRNPNMSNADLSATVDDALHPQGGPPQIEQQPPQLPAPNGPRFATHADTTLALPPPGDANRPPLRTAVVTPEGWSNAPDLSARQQILSEVPDSNVPRPLEPGAAPEPQPQPARAEVPPVDLATQLNPAAQITDMRSAVMAASGNSRAKDVTNFVKVSQAATRPELYNEFQTALDQADQNGGSLSQGMKSVGQDLGILDASGKERDLDADLARAQQLAQNIWSDPRAKTNPGFARKAQDLQSKVIPQIEGLIELRQQAAALKAPKPDTEPETAPPASEAAPAQETPPEAAAPAAPVSVAEQVMAAARSIAGDAGGNVPVDALRRALPDVAKPDLDNALRQINADDTGSELVKAPAGQRAGKDGVTVGDGGKFHMLSVEPQTAAEPASPPPVLPASWVIRDKVTGKPVMETADAAKVAAVNTDKYEAVPTLQHLQEYNAAVKANGGSEPAQIKPDAPNAPQTGAPAPATVGTSPEELPPPGSDPQMDTLQPSEGSVKASPEAVAQDYLAQRQQEEPSPNGELPEQPSLFKTGDGTPSTRAPLAPDVTAQHAARFTSQLRPDLQSRVHVVDTPAGLPPQVLQDAARSGLNVHDLQAVYSGGHAYLIGSQVHSPADVEAALSHEVFGHMGTSERLGPFGSMGYESRIAGIFDRVGGVDGLMKLAKRFGVEKDVGVYVPHEAFTLTPDDKARLVEELIAHASEAPQGKLKQAMMSMTAKLKRGFAETFRSLGLNNFARRFETFGPAEMSEWMAQSRQALGAGGTSFTKQRNLAGAATSFARRIPEQNQDIGALERVTGAIKDGLVDLPRTVNLKGIKRGLKSGTLGWDSFSALTDMARAFHRELPDIQRILDLEKGVKNSLSARFSQLHGSVVQGLYDFGRENPKLGAVLQHMMQMSTQFNLDARRPWEEHAWLPEEMQTPEVKAAHDELRANWNKLGQTPGSIGQGLYQRAVNSGRVDAYSAMAGLLHNYVKLAHADDGINGFGNDFARDFLQRNDLHDDPNAAAQFFRTELMQRVAGARDWLDAKSTLVDPVEREAARRAAKPLNDMLNMIGTNLGKMKESPYFHLGRFGDTYLSMHLLKTEDGKIDPSSFGRLQAWAQENGFGDVALHPLSDEAHIFMRFKSEEDMAAMERFAYQMKKEGLLDPDENITRGAVNAEEFYNDIAPSFLQKMVETARAKAKATDMPTDALNAFVDQVRGIALDMLPDRSMQKVLQKRVGVQGYNANMFQNLAHRGAVSAAAFANMATMHERNTLFAQLRQSVDNAKIDPNADPVRLSDVAKEVMRRSIAKDVRVGQTFLDYANSFIHSYYIGASPGFAMLQVSQIPTLGIPALGKRFGYANSLAAVAKATSKAFGLMRTIATTDTGHRVDAAITPEVLKNTKALSNAEREYMLRLVNQSDIELGGFTRALSDVASNRGQISGAYSKALHWSNATAVYSETFARAIMALAAHDLHAGSQYDKGLDSRVAYGSQILGDSMFNWGSYDTPRQFSKNGVLGPVGPLVGKFHQFTSKLVNLLVHEISEALPGSNATATERREAQRFMLGHTAAVITLAGTLGLPAAAWFAGAATRLTGLANGGEGYDVEAHYHEFLSDMFGKDAAEMVARGLPRYLGVDLSDWGDAEVAPFTRLMEDRRKFEDAWQSYLAHAWGAPLSTVANWVSGSRDIANGRPLEGMSRMLPVALRNVLGAYRIDANGAYVDSTGKKLPIDASTGDIIKTALGLSPGNLEQYQEKRRAITGMQEERTYRSGVIKQNIARAYAAGDTTKAQEWLGKAKEFDADPNHISDMILPGIGSYIAQWQRAQAMARTTGALGVSPRDLGALRISNAY